MKLFNTCTHQSHKNPMKRSK
uniref:Receptor-like protein kinase At3g21340 n=1 Tax=Rhizophora mucronata TaxID=61149 RepID=A0A2P2MEW3_RHIMU